MMIDPDFWQNRRVFLTGHTGFKGSWLSLWLTSMGARVHGYALEPPTDPNLFNLARVAEGMDSTLGDIRDAAALQQAMAEAAPEIVIHMAAQPLVRRSYQEPVETYATNVMGTVNLLEAVRQAPSVRAVVNVTTDKCYQNREWPWGYRENEALGGHDPYSNSKACSELVSAAYRSSFLNTNGPECNSVALATARAGNVIGGGDWAEDRLICDCVRGLLRGEEIVVRRPQAIRPWQHVLEPLSGYLLLAQRLFEDGPAWAEGWNFGPYETDARPVGWLVEQLCALWGESANFRIEDDGGPHEAGTLKLDCSKARERLGWRPRWDLARTLQSIVNWTQAFRDGEDMNRFSLQQIVAYQKTRRSDT